MRRLWLVAKREYLSYARTVGFWLSILLLPVGLVFGAMAPALMQRTAPVRTLAVVDLSGTGAGARLAAVLDAEQAQAVRRALRTAAVGSTGPEARERIDAAWERGGEQAARAELERLSPQAAAAFRAPPRSLRIVPPPQEAAAAASVETAERAVRPYVAGDRRLAGGDELFGALVLHRVDREIAGSLTTASVSDRDVEGAVRNGLREVARQDRLAAAGVQPGLLAEVDRVAPDLRLLSPKAASGGEIGLKDRLPALVGFVLGMVLWSAVLTGAGILMNSVIEEKSNRVLEVLVSSADTAEILFGKVLGVAALTGTVMGAWFLIGAALLSRAAPGLAADLVSTLFQNGLIVYFALYFVGGYLMYAAVFAAIGAFCESTRDAQALLGPVMILLTIPVLVMSIGLRSPDAPVLQALSWVPLFTPFLMVTRAAAEPPLWEVLGTLTLMALTVALVVWLAGRAFHAGALSTTKLDWRGLVARLRSQRAR